MSDSTESEPLPAGAVVELTVGGDGSASTRVLHEAGTPGAEAFSAEFGDPENPVELEPAAPAGEEPHAPRNRIVQVTINADGSIADEDYEYVSEAAREADEERIAFVRSELARQNPQPEEAVTAAPENAARRTGGRRR